MSILQQAQERAEAKASVDPELTKAVAAKRAKVRKQITEVHGILGELSGQTVKLAKGRGRLQVSQTADCACVKIEGLEFDKKKRLWKSTGEDVGGWEIWPTKEGYRILYDSDGVVSATKVVALLDQVEEYMAQQVGDVLLIGE